MLQLAPRNSSRGYQMTDDNQKGSEPQAQLAGYVSCEVLHQTIEWHFEVRSTQPPVGVLQIETGDGFLSFAIHRASAEYLMYKLKLFLEELPPDRLSS
jgi:hypothetical protein